MNKTLNTILTAIVIAILVLITINSYFRVGQGPDDPSKGIIYNWLTK